LCIWTSRPPPTFGILIFFLLFLFQEKARHGDKLSFLHEAVVENWSSKDFNFSYSVSNLVASESVIPIKGKLYMQIMSYLATLVNSEELAMLLNLVSLA
jgi:hypothetical protein